ncbi:LysR substrate-binding domain-containing protein [Orrella sp. JC864]|uniref:LysR family transcriptional regulator n=1 Tax=Orrella sp. JC864 TaxID=3120298 RepID=UPI00300B13C7
MTPTYTRLLSRLKTRHLLLLEGIARHGTLTRAARASGVSQPAATKTLAELEALFGAPLFVRGARLQPTTLGRLALVRARQMLQELENWGQEIDSARAGYGARLHIGAVPYISGELLKAALSALHARHQVVCTLTRATSDQLSQALARYEIDCLIGRPSPANSEYGFTHEVLYPQRPALVAHPSLARRLARRQPDWRQLAKMNWILPSPATPIGMVVTELFTRAQAEPPVPVLETYSLDLIASMLRDDATLVSILPEALARDMARRGDVGIVSWKLDWSLPPVALIRQRRETPLWAEERLVEILREVCAPLVAAAG